MTLLLRDPGAKTGEQATEPTPEAAPEVRTCPTCQAPLEPEQDWCLNCGAAQPGRLAGFPGKRAAATVLALTTLLVGGAVAASYAALQDNPGHQPTTPTQVAQAPAPTPAAPAAPTPSTATPPTPSTATPPSTAPVAPPTTSKPPSTPATPVTPTPSSPSPSKSTGSPSGSNSSSKGSGSTGTGTSSSGDQAQPRTHTTPALPALAPIKLDASAAALYDPYHRDTAAGDATKAIDGDAGTSFPVTVAAGSPAIGAGLVVDVGKLRGIRAVDLTTKTPGFKVELYATDSEELPPDVLDTRWAHIKDVRSVGADDNGTEHIALGGGTTKYRYVLLWFTTPPTDGTTVRISQLKLLG